ncbi:patatin-like phospholipase domain-containing protein [Talaromyces proteolyticus]|uniref:Patatin-like phospholipase domain-containing protein n=1 Tax=Talaromyces proteolyticus TaxID=1131652 RepID=A0AAD4KTG4_9EURO|nr:patatin-like phospholipase domain-containing protein [Talaromyces proteolyticus]KAH8700587.1 patatin-like phospholipase domain-containing protein [Talaromyces proteolyticus]
MSSGGNLSPSLSQQPVDLNDPSLLPDYETEFITTEELRQFEAALNAPAAESLIAINDWRPIRQRVRRPFRRRQKTKPQRTTDETREGVLYAVLKYPFLIIVFGWIFVLGLTYVLTRLYISLYEQLITWTGRRERLRRALHATTNYEDWNRAAHLLDDYLGNEKWKEKDEYAYYDYPTVRNAVTQLRQLREAVEKEAQDEQAIATHSSSATEDLCSLLEACVKNNFVGVENPRLYSEAYSGTKRLVQEYIDEAHRSLESVLESRILTREDKYRHFRHLDTNFGRTALCLSGGATFAYYHFGVVRALLDNGVLPEIIAGTSGGALVAALVATRTDEELKQLLVPALAHRIRACHEEFPAWVKRWWRTGARFDTLDWARQCSWFTRGSMTFREAFERTGRILNVSCVPSDPYSPTILTNYLTSPDCVIWSAVIASAAVPGILNPVVLMKKNRDGSLSPYSFGHKWKDGSLRTDIPIKSLNLHFNVNFTIVSQVNPHVNLFFFSSRGSVGRPVTHRKGRGWRGGFLGSAVEQYIKLDLNKWLRVLRHLELLPRPMGQDWSQIWLQHFSGTITIWPKSVMSDFWNILSDPSPERLARMIQIGQQSAFPKIQFIQNRMKIENLIMQGLLRNSPSGGREPSPLLSRRHDVQNHEPADTLHSEPETISPYHLDVPNPSKTGYSVGYNHHRRNSVMEEMRRQSAVFFDDSDVYGDESDEGFPVVGNRDEMIDHKEI